MQTEAAFMIAKSVFDALGAKTYVINNEPDGTEYQYELWIYSYQCAAGVCT